MEGFVFITASRATKKGIIKKIKDCLQVNRMKNKHHLQKLLPQRLALILISLLLVSACTQEASPEHKPQAVKAKDFKSYSHDGLNLKHPHYWTLVYDDSPSLYADRGVAFDTSEFSRVSVLFYEDRSLNFSNIANQYSRELRLDSREDIDNYKREPFEIAGFKGLRLTWENTIFETISVEVTILTIIDSPNPVFAVFHLLDDDIERESPHIIPFINSILIQ